MVGLNICAYEAVQLDSPRSVGLGMVGAPAVVVWALGIVCMVQWPPTQVTYVGFILGFVCWVFVVDLG